MTGTEQIGADGKSRARVGVFRWEWLPQSETFIRRQSAGLRQFEAVPMGAVPGVMALPTDRILYREGIARRLFAPLALRTGRSVRLRHTIDAEHLDLVHVHFAVDAIAILRSLIRARVPFLVTVHGYDVTKVPDEPGRSGRVYRRRLRRLFDRATAVIAVSDVIAGKARELGATDAKLRTHYIGIPVTDAVTSELDQDIDLLFVGRLVEKKGVSDLLLALALLAESPVPHNTVIVGEGPLRVELESAAMARGLPVTFMGKRSAEEVQDLLLRSKVVVVPSKTAANGDMEGLPTVLMEAMAVGVPVVATRHSGIIEVVEHGETGLLSDEADPEALAANLRRALADPDLRRRLGVAGREHIRQNFNMTTQTAALEEIYAELLAKQ